MFLNTSNSINKMNKRSLKVLAVTRKAVIHKQIGGMEEASHNLYVALSKKGINIEVIITDVSGSVNGESNIEVDGISYIKLQGTEPGIYSNEFHSRVREYFISQSESEKTPYDLIHSVSAAAQSIANLRGVCKVVASWHGTELEKQLDKMAEYVYVNKSRLLPVHVERLILGYFSGLLNKCPYGAYNHHVVLTNYMRSCIEFLGVKNDSVSVIPNGLPDFFFGDFPLRATKVGGKLVLGIVGRLNAMKGLNFLAEVANKLNPDRYKLLFIGSGPDQSILNKFPLEYEIRTYPHNQMQFAYADMDILLNPTFRSSGFDLTIQEALACGTKVVVSNSTQYIEYFNKIKDRYGPVAPIDIFHIGDASSLINAISRIENVRVPDNVYLEIRRNLTVCDMADNYIDLFHKLVCAEVEDER